MRKITISKNVMDKVSDLRVYMTDELKLSNEATLQKIDRIENFLKSLSNPADYPLCRFRRWCELSYRCAIFENDWVFAYEILPEGIIIRDMSHTSLLVE